MVKNESGGSHAKRQGRKYAFAKKEVLRVSTDPDEKYAVVLKVYGNGMCLVETLDKRKYMCHIRNKFRGRSKRDNNAAVNVWVLVGARSYESDPTARGKHPNCDLLEVYGAEEFEQLKARGELPSWAVANVSSEAATAGGSAGAAAAALLENFEFSTSAVMVTDNDDDDDDDENDKARAVAAQTKKKPTSSTSASAAPPLSTSSTFFVGAEKICIDDI